MAGLRVVLLRPHQVRAFAKYKLQRAKNDRLDAALITESVAGLSARQIVFDPHLAQLSEALRRIEQIEADIVRAKTRRESFQDTRLRKTQTREVERLQRLLKAEMPKGGSPSSSSMRATQAGACHVPRARRLPE